jgi:ubiquinone/menaquinone biosynthesis C-methylase UbiE
VIDYIDKKFYSGFGDNWDDEIFRKSILQLVKENDRILDVGAGAGIVAQMNFKGHAREVCGVDLDERVLQNPYLDDAKIGTAECIPYDDASFDVVFSDNVLEHLEEPERVFLEVNRVLKKGGVFLIKTPNKFHYVPLVASLTPHRLHRYYNKRRGREAEDTFPTRYRANSKGALRRLAEQSNFELSELRHIEGRPEYLRISSVTYLAGLSYERVVNRFKFLSSLRVLLIAEFRK